VIAVLAVVALALALRADGDDPDDARAGGDLAERAPTATTAPDDETSATTAPDDDAPATTADDGTTGEDGDGNGDDPAATTTPPPSAPPTTAPVGQLPSGWTPFSDPNGAYTIGVPPGWSAQPGSRANTVTIRQPGTGTYLLIEWRPDPQPDPVADWRSQAVSFANRHDGYQEIRIEPFTYRDYNAAIWEFTFEDGGASLHTANLGFVTAGRGYALYFQTHAENWAGSQGLFDDFRQAFAPT
jgi:hypothetical protein